MFENNINGKLSGLNLNTQNVNKWELYEFNNNNLSNLSQNNLQLNWQFDNIKSVVPHYWLT